MKFYRVSGKKDCPHKSLTSLGMDKGGNEYLKCDDCDAVIIRESGKKM